MTTSQPDSPPSVEILGVPLALTDYQSAIETIDQMIDRSQRGYICVAAVHTVMLCGEDSELREAVRASTFTVPDGQPLVWALRALGHRLNDRVYGPTLMERYCAHAAETGRRIYLYGGRDDEAHAQLRRKLLERYPELKIVGGYSPVHRQLTPEEEDGVVNEINASGADVVWVGIGVPRQEKWMQSLRQRLDAPVLVGVGAAFDFNAGIVPQAPSWMQRAGLEWLYRLIQEPRRLWRRYLRYNPLFVIGFARQYVTSRRATR